MEGRGGLDEVFGEEERWVDAVTPGRLGSEIKVMVTGTGHKYDVTFSRKV